MKCHVVKSNPLYKLSSFAQAIEFLNNCFDSDVCNLLFNDIAVGLSNYRLFKYLNSVIKVPNKVNPAKTCPTFFYITLCLHLPCPKS